MIKFIINLLKKNILIYAKSYIIIFFSYYNLFIKKD